MHLVIHLVTQRTFIEYLLRARHCPRYTTEKKIDKICQRIELKKGILEPGSATFQLRDHEQVS